MKTAMLIGYGYCISVLTIAAIRENIPLALIMSVILGILATFIAKD